MWRFGTVMYLITLFFETAAFFTSFLACCGRLGSAVTGLVAGVALFFGSVAVALMTFVSPPPSFSPTQRLTFRTKQRNFRQGAQRLPRRRPRRVARRVGVWLRLGLVGGAADRHGAVLRRRAREERQQDGDRGDVVGAEAHVGP